MTTLITHADSDEGCRLAQELLAHGERVAVTAHHATSLTRILHGHNGSDVIAIAADVDDPGQFAAVVQRAEARLGRVIAVVDGRDGSRVLLHRHAA